MSVVAMRAAAARAGSAVARVPLWAILMVVALAWLLSPMLAAQLAANDDHEIVYMIGTDGRLWPWEWPGVLTEMVSADTHRFRPVYYALRATEAMLFGDAAWPWYVMRWTLAVATVGAITALVWPLPWPAILALALMPFAGPQAEPWYRLGPQESYGLPLLIGGLALIRWQRAWAGVALLLLAGLVKESFTVVLPLAVVWMWWLQRRVDGPLVTLAAGTLAESAAVLFVLSGGDIYGLTRSPTSVAIVLGFMLGALGPTLWMVPAAGGLFRAPRTVGLALAAAGLLLASQAVVYGGSATPGRYLVPALVGPLLAAAVGFRYLRRKEAILAAAAMVIAMLPAFAAQRPVAARWAAESQEFQRSLAVIKAHPGPLIITSPIETVFEPAVAVERFLAGSRRPPGPCAEVIFSGAGTGRCPIVYYVTGLPYGTCPPPRPACGP